jgi:hypothetical protein
MAALSATPKKTMARKKQILAGPRSANQKPCNGKMMYMVQVRNAQVRQKSALRLNPS